MTVEPARLDMERCASGGIILSSVETRYQLGFVFHAGSGSAPLRASRPHGTCESAMNDAAAGLSASSSSSVSFRHPGIEVALDIVRRGRPVAGDLNDDGLVARGR